MAEWGLSMEQAVSLTEWQISQLIPAYVERTKFEAKVLVGTLGEAMKPKKEQASLASLAAMGFGIKGA